MHTKERNRVASVNIWFNMNGANFNNLFFLGQVLTPREASLCCHKDLQISYSKQPQPNLTSPALVKEVALLHCENKKRIA